MSPTMNGGWQDDSEAEREMLEAWETDACFGTSMLDDWSGDAWRGDEHFEDWPEILAGPEYWLNKLALDAERADGGQSG